MAVPTFLINFTPPYTKYFIYISSLHSLKEFKAGCLEKSDHLVKLVLADIHKSSKNKGFLEGKLVVYPSHSLTNFIFIPNRLDFPNSREFHWLLVCEPSTSDLLTNLVTWVTVTSDFSHEGHLKLGLIMLSFKSGNTSFKY